MTELDLDFVRAQFPALGEPANGWALMDNAGGSVTPSQVSDRIVAYLRGNMVQVGASYPLSQAATENLAKAHAAAELLVGAQPGEVVLGSSTTVNFGNLARALRPTWEPGDAIVVTDLEHESNIGAWRRLAQTGIEVRTWKLRPDTAELALDDLDPLLDGPVRLVAATQCANVVGRIHDVPALAERVHAAGAQLCVDGVAYAPHRLVDVAALGADYYALSLYKVYGPHQGLLWGRRELLEGARGLNHHFIGEDQVPYKLEPGNANHELAAGIPGILDYLLAVDEHHGGDGQPTRAALARTFDRFAAHEAALAERLLDFLRGHPKVRVVGPETSDPAVRVPTIAFCVDGTPASRFPAALEADAIAIKSGHFYAVDAMRALDLDGAAEGVVRVSLVHYNTLAEVDRLVAALDRCLA